MTTEIRCGSSYDRTAVNEGIDTSIAAFTQGFSCWFLCCRWRAESFVLHVERRRGGDIRVDVGWGSDGMV
jgi:hypothetical protein